MNKVMLAVALVGCTYHSIPLVYILYTSQFEYHITPSTSNIQYHIDAIMTLMIMKSYISTENLVNYFNHIHYYNHDATYTCFFMKNNLDQHSAWCSKDDYYHFIVQKGRKIHMWCLYSRYSSHMWSMT